MRRAGIAAIAACAALAAGCGLFGDSAKKPAPLADFTATVKPVAAWSVSVGTAGGYRFQPDVKAGRIHAAAADGTITILEEDSGRVSGRVDAKRKLSSGVGAERDTILVGTIKGEVVALDGTGKELWSAKVGGEVLAPVTVARQNAIVRTSDGRIFAFALADGKRRWVYQRATPALLLRADAGVLATPTSVVAGYPGGKLIALDLDDGKLTWEVTVSLPRGATELERVADVAGLPVIDAGRICAAAFQGKVACFDIQGGNMLWTRELSSATGLAADDRSVYVADDQDNVHALDRDAGASRWKQDKLARRRLTAPLAVEGKVVVGDSLGYVHVLSREDGSFIGRHATDGTAINAIIAAKSGVLVQTAGGTLTLLRL